MIRHWNKLPKELVDSLEISKSHLDVAPGTWLRGDCGAAGLTLGLDDLAGLFQPWWFCNFTLQGQGCFVEICNSNDFHLVHHRSLEFPVRGWATAQGLGWLPHLLAAPWESSVLSGAPDPTEPGAQFPLHSQSSRNEEGAIISLCYCYHWSKEKYLTKLLGF